MERVTQSDLREYYLARHEGRDEGREEGRRNASRQRRIAQLRQDSADYYAARMVSEGYWACQRAELLAAYPDYHTAEVVGDLRGTPLSGVIWMRPNSGGRSRQNKFGPVSGSRTRELRRYAARLGERQHQQCQQSQQCVASRLCVLGLPAHPAAVRALAAGCTITLRRWEIRGSESVGELVASYLPYGDERDAAAFAAADNQELRRRILAACGDRVLPPETRELVQQDDFGALYRVTQMGVFGEATRQQVRVVCPSTGAVYWLPVSNQCRTAHQAVAETFGLSASEYQPAVEA